VIDISLPTPPLRSKLSKRLIGGGASFDALDLALLELRSDWSEADFRLSFHAHKNSSKSIVKSTIQSADSLFTKLAKISTSESPGWVGVGFSLSGNHSELKSRSDEAKDYY